MPEARRHHYVSQFYLKNFVANRDEPKFFVVDFCAGKNFIQSITNVAFEKDFHAFITPGQPRDFVEKQFSKVEGEIAPALARIVEAASLSNAEDAGHLFYFAVLLMLKNPKQRTVFDGIANMITTKMAKIQVSDDDAWRAYIRERRDDGEVISDADASEMRAAILRDDYTVSLSTEAYLQMEFRGVSG